jgi:hypothetical protein
MRRCKTQQEPRDAWKMQIAPWLACGDGDEMYAMGTPTSGQSHQVGAANAPLLHANPPAAAQRSRTKGVHIMHNQRGVAIRKYFNRKQIQC